MRVAVYGTLKRGFGNHRLIDGQGGEFIGETTLKGFEMFSAGYFPVVYPSSEQDTITIQVFDVDDIRPLDSLEGHPTWYKRQEVDTEYGKAWLYVMQDESYKSTWEHVQSGNFNK